MCPSALGGLVDARLLVSADGDEVLVAMATRAADGLFVADGLRDLLFAIVREAAGRDLEAAQRLAVWPARVVRGRGWGSASRLSDRTLRRRSE